MAYGLQARFDRHDPPFDVAALVSPELDRIVPLLFAHTYGGGIVKPNS